MCAPPLFSIIPHNRAFAPFSLRLFYFFIITMSFLGIFDLFVCEKKRPVNDVD